MPRSTQLPNWLFDIIDEEEELRDSPSSLRDELNIDITFINSNIKWSLFSPFYKLIGRPYLHPLLNLQSSSSTKQTYEEIEKKIIIDLWGPCFSVSFLALLLWIGKVHIVTYIYLIWFVTSFVNHCITRAIAFPSSSLSSVTSITGLSSMSSSNSLSNSRFNTSSNPNLSSSSSSSSLSSSLTSSSSSNNLSFINTLSFHLSLLGYSLVPLIFLLLLLLFLSLFFSRISLILIQFFEFISISWSSSSAFLSYYILLPVNSRKDGKLFLLLPVIILMNLYLVALIPLRN